MKCPYDYSDRRICLISICSLKRNLFHKCAFLIVAMLAKYVNKFFNIDFKEFDTSFYSGQRYSSHAQSEYEQSTSYRHPR